MKVDKLSKARVQIVSSHPFFATLLLHAGIEPRTDIPTACVDTRGRIYYNPDFFEHQCSTSEVMFILAHELLHKAMRHLARLGNKNLPRWNRATDRWINETLVAEGIGTCPATALRRPGAEQLTAEQLYELEQELGSDTQPSQGGAWGTGNDLESCEGITEQEATQLATDIRVQVAQAAQAMKQAQMLKRHGEMTAALQKIIAEILHTPVPWNEVLERCLVPLSRQDTTWAKPNRRFSDFYLPSLQKRPEMACLVVQVDISGSISREELQMYNGHLKSIVAQVHPKELHVLYTDTEVKHHIELESPDDFDLTFYSGGGTDMEEGFVYCKEHGLEPNAFVCLTDGATPYNTANAPEYPVFWVLSSQTPGYTPTYGTVIYPEQ